MTLLYMFGLAAGSLVAYGLEKVLNPIVEHPCGPLPTPDLTSAMYETTVTAVENITRISIIHPSTTIITTPTTNISTTLISYLLSTQNSSEIN